jgi:hypothetical protein
VVWTEMPGLRWVVEDLERMTRQLRIVQSRYAGDPRQLNFSGVFGSATTDGLSLTPLEYFRRNCYIGASILSPYDVHWVNVLGADRIMWGHDFPHPEGAIGHTTEALRANFSGFKVEECRDLFAGTAAGVYHFDLEALAPIAAEIGPLVDLVHTPLGETPHVPGSPFWDASELTEALNRI